MPWEIGLIDHLQFVYIVQTIIGGEIHMKLIPISSLIQSGLKCEIE